MPAGRGRNKKQNTGEIFPSGAVIHEPFAISDGVCYCAFVGYPNSKCTEKNSAEKKKNGAHHEYIESQGKVQYVLPC